MVCQNRHIQHCGYTNSDKHCSHEHTSKHNSSPVFRSLHPEPYLSFKAGMMFRSLKSMASDGTHICSPISVLGMSVIWCGPETHGFVNTTGSSTVTVTSSSP